MRAGWGGGVLLIGTNESDASGQSVARVHLAGKVFMDALPPVGFRAPVAGAHLGHARNVGGRGLAIDETRHGEMIKQGQGSVVGCRSHLADY